MLDIEISTQIAPACQGFCPDDHIEQLHFVITDPDDELRRLIEEVQSLVLADLELRITEWWQQSGEVECICEGDEFVGSVNIYITESNNTTRSTTNVEELRLELLRLKKHFTTG